VDEERKVWETQKAESVVQLLEVNIIASDYSEYRLCFQGKLLEVLGVNI
jgi:hypothetical protein